MIPNQSVWVLEDDETQAEIYREIFDLKYSVTILYSLKELESALKHSSPSFDGNYPDLLIADLRLKDGHFLKFLSENPSSSLLQFPFMMVSSCDDLDILRECFDEGALDYLTKPFTKNELKVKVERIMNRAPAPEVTDPAPAGKLLQAHEQLIKFENLTQDAEEISFDPNTLSLRKGIVPFAQLTSKEVQLFFCLQNAGNNGAERENLLKSVWRDVVVSAKTLDVHLFNLRKKIKPGGLEIQFIPPHQYVLLRNRVQTSV